MSDRSTDLTRDPGRGAAAHGISMPDIPPEEAFDRLARVEESLRFVLSNAHCLLWHAVVRKDPAVSFGYNWTIEVFDDVAAQRFIPLEVHEGESYTDAWNRSKLEEDLAPMHRTSHQALESGESSYSQEFRCRRSDGQIRWIYEQAYLEPLEPGQWRVAGVCTDITDRKAAEEALEFLAGASEVLAGSLDYTATLRSAARLCVPLLADLCVVDIAGPDGAIEEIAVEAVDSVRAGVVHDLHRRYPHHPNAETPLAGDLRSGRSVLVEDLGPELLETWAQDASHLELLQGLGATTLMAIPLTAHGRTMGTMTLMRTNAGRRYTAEDRRIAEDLARRTATAVENAVLYRELQQADAAKDRFLAMLGHELRNPLAAITSAIHLIGTAGASQAVRDRAAVIASRQVGHMKRLIDDLLDVSRITRGKVTLQIGTVSIAELLQYCAEAAQPLMSARTHELYLDLPPAPLEVDGDTTRLEQILGNLLNNAARYTPPGGKIRLSACQQDGEAVIRVRDNGAGIPADLLAGIFDLFVQGEGETERSQGGLGIGLTLVRSLAELHGGRVDAWSDGPGLGSTFEVRLPVKGC